MAAAARHLMMRGFEYAAGSSASIALSQAKVNSTAGRDPTTQALIKDLKFAQSKTIRTSTVILATFNILAAFATASSILYDCYFASKRSNPKFKASKFCISSIHPAETFPLVLSIGIVIQGLVFANVQGIGLQSLNTDGCGLIAQYMWPALFIVPYLQLVFGIECAIRSLRKTPFQARGKYDVTICGGVVLLMLIGTWIPSRLSPQTDACFASLVWFISDFGKLGFFMLSTCAGLMIIVALTIFFRLSRTHVIDQHQRITASRMVYYLILGIVSLGFIIPYFASWIIGKGDLICAMIATVVLNLSGLMSGLMQLFLRSNTATTSFGPRGEVDEWDSQPHEIRMFGPNELAFSNHLTEPVSGPRNPIDDDYKKRPDSGVSLIGRNEKPRMTSMESLESPPFRSPIKYEKSLEANAFTLNEQAATPTNTLLSAASTTQMNLGPKGHSRKKSYNLYPNDSSDYNGKLTPPRVIFAGKGHRRDSSMASTATVQIGLRLSNALLDMGQPPLPSISNVVRPGSPRLAIVTQTLPIPEPVDHGVYRPSPLQQAGVKSPVPSPPHSGCINKNLPPTPRSFKPASPAKVVLARESTTQLSPMVYSPQKKVTASPREVTTPRSAGPLRKSPLASPVTQVERSNSQPGEPLKAKAEWI